MNECDTNKMPDLLKTGVYPGDKCWPICMKLHHNHEVAFQGAAWFNFGLLIENRMWTDEGHCILPCELYLSRCYFMLLTGIISKKSLMSRLCIFTDSYGWVAKATLWGSLSVNTVNHNHTLNKFSSTSWQSLEMPSLERDKELILWHLQPGLSL